MEKSIIACLILCLLSPIDIEAKKIPFGNGLYWELKKEILIISGQGDMGNCHNIQKNNEAWFNNEICGSITSIIIESGITSIGDSAFFNLNKVESVSIPNTINSIGCYAFSDCKRLTSIAIPSSVMKIESSAFSGCYALRKAEFLSIDHLCFIDFVGFASNPLHYAKHLYIEGHEVFDIVIPEGVRSIGRHAFENCEYLLSVTIPSTVEEIRENPFEGCIGLNRITVNSNNKIFDSRMNCNAVINTKRNWLIVGCKTTTIPNTVVGIGYNAFYDCTSLTSIIIPNSVKEIGLQAFENCKNLTTVTIPYSVQEISMMAFWCCGNLSSVTILNPHITIGTNAFYGCNTKNYYLAERELSYNGKKYIRCYDQITDEHVILSSSGELFSKEYERIICEKDTLLKIKENGYFGLISINGRTIIPTSRGYTDIGSYNKANKTFSFTKKGYTGLCNEFGQEISVTQTLPTINEIKLNGGYSRILAVSSYGDKSYIVSNGKLYGLVDKWGKTIIPLELEAIEDAGGGYLRFKVNGYWGVMNLQGTTIIPTSRGYTSIGNYISSQKIFPYTMSGFKGECNDQGEILSKIRVEKPQQVVTAHEERNKPKEEIQEQTIIIEHKRNPVPVQVWVPCSVCNNSGVCQVCKGNGYTGFGSTSSRCISCSGMRRCSYCAGQGGHYETRYQ